MSPLWEQRDFQSVAGDAWRPGGLEVTRRGLELCVARCGLKRGALALDLGCGPGASLELLSAEGYRALGLDRNTQPAWARLKAAVGVLQADACCLPLADNSLDAVLCECVLSLLDDPCAVLRACRRALRPGGALLVSDLFLRAPGGKGLPGTVSLCSEARSSCADGARAREEWESLFAQAGFFLHSFEDHSRALAELAARLIWYGAADAPGMDCRAAHGVCTGGRAPGYGLWIAQKEPQ